MGGFSKLQCFKRTYKRGNIFAVALLLLMIVGWEKPAGSKSFPLPLTMLKYFMRSEGCAMQTKHDVTALNELLLCAFFRVFSRFWWRATMTEGYQTPIVAESRKEGKTTEPSLWNIQGVAVITLSQKYFLICHQDLNPCLKRIGSIPFPSSFNSFQMFILKEFRFSGAKSDK